MERGWRASAIWTSLPPRSSADTTHHSATAPATLHSLRRNTTDDSFAARLRANPRPALLWTLGVIALVAIEIGALVNTVVALPGIPPLPIDVPTLLSREVIPNRGYWIPNTGWQGTFLGLPPAFAWGLRVLLIYVYAAAWFIWWWVGYRLYRSRYRAVETTPTDMVLCRLRGHRWGQFGVVIVFLFVVTAVFAPALGPTTFDRVRAPSTLHHLTAQPVLHGTVTYFDEDIGEVRTINAGFANLMIEEEVGILSYDAYGRFHPFGTTYQGTDLFTELLFGARMYLFVGLVTVAVAGTIALVCSVLSGTDRRFVDSGIAVVSDAMGVLPLIPVVCMVVIGVDRTWVTPGILLVLLPVLFGLLVWPALWRTLRAPVFRTVESDWVEAARGFGESSGRLLGTRVTPHIVGFLCVYALLIFGGAIITTAAVGWFGAGIWVYPMGWARFIEGSPPHFLIPAVALVVVVAGFTALADGLRDAIDPEREIGTSAVGETAGAGGGG